MCLFDTVSKRRWRSVLDGGSEVEKSEKIERFFKIKESIETAK